MSTVAIYNGYGKYERNDKNETGINLTYGGVPFWLPYKKVAYIPDFTFREVDHDKTAAEEGEEGVLTYKSFRVSGERIAEELLDTQIPVQNKDKGIIRVSTKNQNGKFINVYAGMTEEGMKMTAEVAEVVVSESEAAHAERLARQYKEQIIQEYFQSKRERMSGGKGRLIADGLTKVYMEELGVRDIDALPTQQNSGNLEELLTRVLTKAETGGKAPAPPQKPQKTENAAAQGLV